MAELVLGSCDAQAPCRVEKNYFSRYQPIKTTKVDIKRHKFEDSKFKFLSGTDKWVQFDLTEDSGFQKSIHYFSDRHSLEGNCPSILNCKTTDRNIPRRTGLRPRERQSSGPCYDLLYFLEKMFEDAYKNKVYMDLFLEYPYNILKNDDLSNTDSSSYLHMVYDKFHNCFTLQKQNCKYSPYVRVHYTDLRLTYDAFNRTVASTQIVADIMEDFLELTFSSSLPNKESFVNSFLFLNELFKFNFDKGFDLFEILMTKDDYQNDLIDFYQPFKTKIKKLKPSFILNSLIDKYEQYISDLLSLYKKRNNKKVFIAKHQLDELRKDNVKFNGRNIVDLITKNLLDTRKVVNEQFELDIYQKWRNLIQKYLKLVNEWTMENLKIFFNSFVDVLDELSEVAVSVDAIMLDAYILPRIFRKFSNPSTLTFVMAGSGHIEFEVDFYKNVIGVEPLHEVYRVEGTKQCLYYKDFWKIFDIKNYQSGKIRYYSLMTVQQIKQLLKENNVKGYTNKSKDKLIEMVRKNDVSPGSKKYDQMTVVQLIDEFKRRKIKGYSGKRKSELIALLEESSAPK